MFLGAACGTSWMPSLFKLASPHDDLAALAKLGFIVDELGSNIKYSAMDATNVWVTEQDEKAALFGKVMLKTISLRVLTMANYMFALPWGFVLLASEAHHKDAALRRLKLIDEAWEAIQPLKTTCWKKFRDMCCMRMQLVNDIMLRLRRVRFEDVQMM